MTVCGSPSRLMRPAKLSPLSRRLLSPNITKPHLNFNIVDNITFQASDGETLRTLGHSQKFAACISFNELSTYIPLCDDFGPGSINLIYEFYNVLEEHVKQRANKFIFLQSSLENRALTNAVFLVGSYLLVKFNLTPDEIVDHFQPANDLLVSFRDVSPGEQNFHLHLRDCWAGLWKAKQLGWVKTSFQGFDAGEYQHFANPFNADLHEVVPGKFIAMRGPKGMPAGQLWRDVKTGDGRFSHRELSPEYYVDILRQLDVQAVVRLNTAEYRKEAFTDAGLGFVDLYFEDCTCPPADVVAKFMMIAEGLPGALAVHCKSGLGRAGTLIALYMMQHHDFTAREAMGWLRIVRPGSVIGPQQQYLVEREAVMRRTGAQYSRGAGPAAAAQQATEPEAVALVIADAVSVVDARLRSLRAPRPRCRRLSLDSSMAQLRSLDGPGAGPVAPLTGRPDRASTGVRHLPQVPLLFCADLLPLPTA